MPSPLPVLRAPPFPGPRVAMVSQLRTEGREWRRAHRDGDGGDDAALIAAIRRERVGGAFWAAAPPAVTGDPVVLAPADAADARAMLADALRDADPAQLVVLLPDRCWARAVRRRLAREGVAAAIGDVDPWPLLAPDTLLLAHGDDERVLLAQIAGARVRVRSTGRFAPADARRLPTVTDRAIAELVLATAYRDPWTGAPADAAATVALLGEWRRMIDANRGIAVATGMARWKRREIATFLWAGRPLRFARTAERAVRIAAAAGGAIAVWPSRTPPGLDAAAAAAGVPLHSVEDGFIRSIGLGAACVPPLSIAVDARGIHYDPDRASDLEAILSDTAFTPDQLVRAQALADYVVTHGIGKYGVADAGGDAAGDAEPAADPEARTRPRILVTGQVEDDLSVRMGGAGVAGNLDLLARVRAAEPGAEIWYRPHPDVDAGLRAGRIADADALVHADAVLRGGSMAALFAQVDGVHVLTSLAGFEALLRGLPVTVHGLPFYAGWGLTRDLAPPIVRRTRRLTLPELVAGVLILYPRYLDPATGLPCRVERMTETMANRPSSRPSWLTRLRMVQGRLLRRAKKG